MSQTTLNAWTYDHTSRACEKSTRCCEPWYVGTRLSGKMCFDVPLANGDMVQFEGDARNETYCMSVDRLGSIDSSMSQIIYYRTTRPPPSTVLSVVL